MRILEMALDGHLTCESLDQAIASVAPEMDGQRVLLLIDCREMTGYDDEARGALMRWHRDPKTTMARTAVLSRRRMWHIIVAAMSTFSRVPMQAFEEPAIARAWLTAEDSRPPVPWHALARMAQGAPSPPVPAPEPDPSLDEAPREGVLVRGAGVMTMVRVLREQVSESQWSAMLATLDAAATHRLRKLQPLRWLEAGLGGELLHAYRQVAFAQDAPEHRRRVVEIGHQVAAEHLRDLLRLTVQGLDTHELVDLLPDLWGRYYRGIRCEVTVAPNQTQARLRVEGGASIKYLQWLGKGWMTCTLESVGTPSVLVEVHRPASVDAISSDLLEFDLSWRVQQPLSRSVSFDPA